MEIKLKPRIVVGAVAGLAVAGGGAALAANHFASPKDESQAVLNDAANQLGVKPSALSAALKKALENRVDAAVAAGRLTKDQGAELKQRIEAGDLPFLGFPLLGARGFPHPGMRGFGFFGRLDPAASYLGLTGAQLKSRINSGKTLAEIAKAQGKSVDGLVDTLYAAEKKKLDDAVATGRLTKSQEQSILADAKTRIRDFVENAQLRLHRDDGHEFGGDYGHEFKGAPPGAPSEAPRFIGPGI